MRLEVITPQAVVFEGDVTSVVAPLPDGWIGVLPEPQPLRCATDARPGAGARR